MAVAMMAFGALSGCSDMGGPALSLFENGEGEITGTIQEPDAETFMASDEPYRLGVEHFNRGYYGNATKYFQEAIEKSPIDSAAWISLAACYDQLRLFDLADKSYDRAISLEGQTPQILNNLGYSYVLRGDLRKARRKFQKVLDIDPDNVMARNNLERLERRKAS